MATSDSPAGAAFPTIRVGSLLKVNARPRLARLARDLADRYGAAEAKQAVPASLLAEAAKKLAASGGDLEGLTQRERKAAVELLWNEMEGWRAGERDVRRWLAWADDGWGGRVGVTRVAMSYLRNFDPDHVATGEIGRWLAPRAGISYGPFGHAFARRRLFAPDAALEVARELLAGDASFVDEVEGDVRSRSVLRGSGFAVAVAEQYGRRCGNASTKDVGRTLRRLLDLVGERGLDASRGSGVLRSRARVSLVSGLVMWGRRSAGNVDPALELVLSLLDDPRATPAAWRGIPDEVRHEVEGWLTARTLENLFRVIEQLKTDRQDMAQERAEFWRGYLPFIRRAFLLCAPRAEPFAERLKEPFGRLESQQKDHCGILLELAGPAGDRLTIFEVNKNGRVIFWRQGSQATPSFYDFAHSYDRDDMLRRGDSNTTHQGGWQAKVSDFIEAETGVRRARPGRRTHG